MKLNQVVKATAYEELSFGIRFKYQEKTILVKSPELSWYPGKLDEEEKIKIGQVVPVKILHKLENEFTGSVRDAIPEENPWLTPPNPGEVFTGKVVLVAEYGYFIRFSKNLFGLLHIENSKGVYSLNQMLSVKVLSINLAKQRINLTDQS